MKKYTNRNLPVNFGMFVIFLFSLYSSIFCTSAVESKTLKVAVAGPFTGSVAAFGEMIKKGAQLRAQEINESGGINGKQLELVFEDDTGKDKEASLVATRIASNRKILAVVGHFNSSCSLAGKPIYKRNRIVALSPGSTNVNVCKGSDYTFRNLYRDDFQGAFAAKYIKTVLTKVETVAVFFDNDDYGRGLRDSFKKSANSIGLSIVADEAYDRDTTDYKAQLTKIKSANPDLIFIAGLYSQAGLILSQARESGITAQFFGADGVDSPKLLEIAGESANGIYITTPFIFGLEGNEEAERVYAAFKQKFGKSPDTWAALTYDAIGMIAEAITEGGEKRKAIRDYLGNLTSPEKGYQGITGLTYFDEHGDCLKPAYVKQVAQGQFIAASVQMLD